MCTVEPDDSVEKVELRHPQDRKELLDMLISGMRSTGWRGRPLLVVERNNSLCAVTGSHRAAAAMELGLEIPVVIIHSSDLTKEQWKQLTA